MTPTSAAIERVYRTFRGAIQERDMDKEEEEEAICEDPTTPAVTL